MPDQYFMCTRTIPYYTGLPEDVVTNTFHFKWFGGSDPVLADYQALRDKTAAFYEYIFSSGSGVQMAQWARPALSRFKIYCLEDPKPRVPRYDTIDPLTVGQDTAGTIVPEAAICVSISGSIISGDSAARRRGRVFLGALGNSCMGVGGASQFPIVTSLATTRAAAAAATMCASLDNWNWSVFSPTTFAQTGSYEPAYSAVVQGWVDNAFDTQRRRENKATTRTTFGPV